MLILQSDGTRIKSHFIFAFSTYDQGLLTLGVLGFSFTFISPLPLTQRSTYRSLRIWPHRIIIYFLEKSNGTALNSFHHFRFFRGRPRGSGSRHARVFFIASSHFSSPKGRFWLMHRRTAASSACVCGRSTHARQSARLSAGCFSRTT